MNIDYREASYGMGQVSIKFGELATLSTCPIQSIFFCTTGSNVAFPPDACKYNNGTILLYRSV